MKKQFLYLNLFLTIVCISGASGSNNNLQVEGQTVNPAKFIFVSEEEINNGDNKDKMVVKMDSSEKDVKIKIFKPFCSKNEDLYDGCMNSGFLFKEELITPKILFCDVQNEIRKKLAEGQKSDLLKLNKNLLRIIFSSLDIQSLSKLRETCKFFAHFIISPTPNPWNFTNVSWKNKMENNIISNNFIESYEDLCLPICQNPLEKATVNTLNPFFYLQITSLLPTSSTIAVEECFEDFYIGSEKMNIGPRLHLKRGKLTFEKIQEAQTTLSLKMRVKPLSLISCELTPYSTILCGNKKTEFFLRKITVNYGDKTLTITPAEFKNEYNTLPRLLILEEKDEELSLTNFGSLSNQRKSDFFHKIYFEKSKFLKKEFEKK